MRFATITTIAELKGRRRSIFVFENDLSVFVSQSITVEIEISVINSISLDSSKDSLFADPSASVENTNASVPLIVHRRIRSVIAKGAVAFQRILLGQRNATTNDPWFLIACGLVPGFRDHVHSTTISAVQITRSDYHGIYHLLPAVDLQDLAAQALPPF